MAEKQVDGKCPCCGGDVKVTFKPAKWQGEKDKVVIEHKKWVENWK